MTNPRGYPSRRFKLLIERDHLRTLLLRKGDALLSKKVSESAHD